MLAPALAPGPRMRYEDADAVERRMTLFALVVSAMLLANWLARNAEVAPRRTAVAAKHAVGEVVDVAITLVSTDARALACASADAVGGKHCELESQTRPWSRPSEGGAGEVVAPYKTIPDDQTYLVAGLFDEPALRARLAIDPPDFAKEHLRFTARCKLRLDGKLAKAEVRWEPRGPFFPVTHVWVGTPSACSIDP